MYFAILVYTPGNCVPQLTPNETTPTIVERPVLASFKNNGPPESPWQASRFSTAFNAHICVSLNSRRAGWFESRLNSTNVRLQLSSGIVVTFAFSIISDRFVPVRKEKDIFKFLLNFVAFYGIQQQLFALLLTVCFNTAPSCDNQFLRFWQIRRIDSNTCRPCKIVQINCSFEFN